MTILAIEVVEKAVSLLSREHCTARLEKIWGPGDGRPVAELKTVMDQLLQEYLLSRELDEAARCVRELKATHFHHELVKRGVKIAMEQDGKSRWDSRKLGRHGGALFVSRKECNHVGISGGQGVGSVAKDLWPT